MLSLRAVLFLFHISNYANLERLFLAQPLIT